MVRAAAGERRSQTGHTLIVVSMEDATALVKTIHRREQPYKLGVVKGEASFSGMWIYKDDHTDVRVLGAIAKALPEVFSLASVEKFIGDKLKSTEKAASARTEFNRFATVDVKAGQGNSDELYKFDLPGWKDMRRGVSITGQPQGGPYPDPGTKKVGGFRPGRN